jgi:hypothetical protein
MINKGCLTVKARSQKEIKAVADHNQPSTTALLRSSAATEMLATHREWPADRISIKYLCGMAVARIASV